MKTFECPAPSSVRKTSTIVSSVLWAESLDLPRKSVTDSLISAT